MADSSKAIFSAIISCILTNFSKTNTAAAYKSTNRSRLDEAKSTNISISRLVKKEEKNLVAESRSPWWTDS